MLLLLLAACQGGGLEKPSCGDFPRPAAFTETTDLGVSADDVLAGVPTTESTTLTYDDGVTTELTLGFSPGDTVRYVEGRIVRPDGSPASDSAGDCPDRLEIEGTFAFATADGAFDESFSSTLVSTTDAPASLTQPLDLPHLAGTFDLEPLVTVEFDELTAAIVVSWVEGVSAGLVTGTAAGSEDCARGEVCSDWQQEIAVGAWPSPPASDGE